MAGGSRRRATLSPTWISDALNIYSAEQLCEVLGGDQRYEFPERSICTGWRSESRRGDTRTWDSVTPCSHFYAPRRRSRVTLNAPKLVPMRRWCGPLPRRPSPLVCQCLEPCVPNKTGTEGTFHRNESQIPHYFRVTNTFFLFHNIRNSLHGFPSDL